MTDSQSRKVHMVRMNIIRPLQKGQGRYVSVPHHYLMIHVIDLLVTAAIGLHENLVK